jgi:hypothetical protein
VISTFSLMSAVASIVCGMIPHRLPIRFSLAFIGATLLAGTLVLLQPNLKGACCAASGASRPAELAIMAARLPVFSKAWA